MTLTSSFSLFVTPLKTLLMYFFRRNQNTVFLTEHRIYTAYSNILEPMYAILECNSTSDIFGIGEGQAIQGKPFRENTLVFSDDSAKMTKFLKLMRKQSRFCMKELVIMV